MMKDLWLIMLGRSNFINSQQMIARNATAIISDVFCQVMSGQSARDSVLRMWPIEGEPVDSFELTREERKAIIQRHNEILNAKKK